MDGKLYEPVWKTATAYPLYLSKDKIAAGQKLNEAGEVRFAWDDNFFYVAAQFQGTLNNWHDKDKSWTAEMAMPIEDLQAYCAKFSQQANWKILIGRYNYSRYLQDVELSMTPQLSKTNYHLNEEYADLELVH